MGIFDKAENEAENLAQKDPNLADKGLNEVGQEANQMTGDRFGSQIDQGVQAAENRFGQQGGNQDPNQGGGYQQDPSQGQGGNQDPNQGQGGYQQDPNQGGYDPNQGQDPNQDPNQGQGQDQNQGQGQDQNQNW